MNSRWVNVIFALLIISMRFLNPSWKSLVPPLLVLAFAIITNRITSALILGIISAAYIACNYDLVPTLHMITTYGFNQITDLSNIYIFVFLIALGILISLLNVTGGTTAYSTLIRKKIVKAKDAESASILLSFLLSFDDFFSCITVGCIMRPLTDLLYIPRAKLAFLIDSLAAPLVMLVPVSSWIAMLMMQLDKSGISLNPHDKPLVIADPFFTYLTIIPFIFYSFIIIASVIFIVRRRISFGTMKKHEEIAQTTHNLFGGKAPLHDGTCPPQHGSFFDFLFPILLLLCSVFFFLLFSGGYHVLGGTRSFLEAMKNTNIFFALCTGSLITLFISTMYFLIRKKITFNTLVTECINGFRMMGPSIIILFLAWTFSSLLLNELHSGLYLAHILTGIISSNLLPFLFFIVAAIASIAMGSSWGTIAILVPLATPLAINILNITAPTTLEHLPLLVVLMGAIFAGAVAGDHVSPLSSTTLMSATSAQAYLLDHVRTQFEYSIPALLSTALAYLITGLLLPKGLFIAWIIGLGVGLVLCLITLSLLSRKKE